jgi:hypothetical protein
LAGIGVLNPLYQPDLPVTKDNENTIECRELNMLRPEDIWSSTLNPQPQTLIPKP